MIDQVRDISARQSKEMTEKIDQLARLLNVTKVTKVDFTKDQNVIDPLEEAYIEIAQKEHINEDETIQEKTHDEIE